MPRRYFEHQPLNPKQEQLVTSFEAIGDLLIHETKRRNRNSVVLRGIEEVTLILEDLLTRQTNDPEGFRELVLSSDLDELSKSDPLKASLVQDFYPGESFVTITSGLSQMVRIHKAGLENHNQEICYHIAARITHLLERIAIVPDNSALLNTVFSFLYDVAVGAQTTMASSAFPSSARWFIRIAIGDKYRDDKFHPSNFPVFVKWLFTSLTRIIDEDRLFPLFQDFVSTSHQGIIFNDHPGVVWEYAHLFLEWDLARYGQLNEEENLQDDIAQLESSLGSLFTNQEVDSWLSDFHRLAQRLETEISPQDAEAAQEVKTKIEDSVKEQFLLNKLREIFVVIGAQCLFRKRYDYVTYMWDFKQPPDSDATWVGHDIFPRTIKEALILYLSFPDAHRWDIHWDDHHGCELYIKQYFLFLLTRTCILQSRRPNADDGLVNEIDFSTCQDIHFLGGIGFKVRRLFSVLPSVVRDKESQSRLTLEGAECTSVTSTVLPQVLAHTYVMAEKRLKEIERTKELSPAKVQGFQDKVKASLVEYSPMRRFCERFGEVKVLVVNSSPTDMDRVDLEGFLDRANFFDRWHIHYFDPSEDTGRQMGRKDHKYLLDCLYSRCERLRERRIEDVLEDFSEETYPVILTDRSTPRNWVIQGKKIIWRDHHLLSESGANCLFMLNDRAIPIFTGIMKTPCDHVIILDARKIGPIVQVSCESPGQNGQKEQILELEFIDLARDPAAVDDIIS